MLDFWYNYIKQNYYEKYRFCYVDADTDTDIFFCGFIVCIKTDNIYNKTAGNVKTRFDISNDELRRPLPKWTNKKVVGLTKDELGGIIKVKFVGLRGKTYI